MTTEKDPPEPRYHCCRCHKGVVIAIRCARCDSRYYCGTQCQREDFKKHRVHCDKIARLSPRKRPVDFSELTSQECLAQLKDIVRRCAISGPDLDPFGVSEQRCESYRTTRAIGTQLASMRVDTTLLAAAHEIVGEELQQLVPNINFEDQIRISNSLALAWQGIGDWQVNGNC